MIRKMEASDIPDCADILCGVYNNELWQCRWDRGTAIRYLTDFYRAEKFIGFVLEHEGRIVAAMFCREKVWWNNSELVIEEMFVRPECQRQGFGTALLQKAEEYVIGRGLAGKGSCQQASPGVQATEQRRSRDRMTQVAEPPFPCSAF